MHFKIRWTPLLTWFVVSCIAVLSCSLTRYAAHIGDEYFPMGNDSFYHARRILDAVHDPASFYEFDPKIHAPEGSLLPWPWGYDYVVAKIVRGALAIGIGSDPLMVALWIPVVAVVFGLALLMLLARRLGLGDWAVALAGLCMALSANTQLLFGFGELDHHYAEYMCILASLAAGLAWFRTPGTSSAIVLGATFGAGLAIHNGLFILQLPFLATAVLYWLHDKRAPMRQTLIFAAALVGSTLAILLPSLPFQEGRFEFYTLSWFHLYVVCCTAVVMLLFAKLQPTRRNMIVLLILGAALIAPLFKQIAHARAFITGSLGMLDQIMEMRPPLQLALDGRPDQLFGLYSLLVVIAPITFVLCAVRLWRERAGHLTLFWMWCVFGLLLMTTQIRMHYFGIYALYLPWLIVLQEYADKRPELHKRAFLLGSLALLLAYSPVIRYALVAPTPHAGDEGFKPGFPAFIALRKACAEDPGVVLADTNAGHYIRFFTDCPVIANNFLLTEQHFQKADEVQRLFGLRAEQLTRAAPYVKYVLVRAGGITPNRKLLDYAFFGLGTPVMPSELLLETAGAPPPEFKLIYEVSVTLRRYNSTQHEEVPYAKLYKIEPAGTSAPRPSVPDVSE
jgi:hypothetical protein